MTAFQVYFLNLCSLLHVRYQQQSSKTKFDTVAFLSLNALSLLIVSKENGDPAGAQQMGVEGVHGDGSTGRRGGTTRIFQ